ncbi:bifunctional pyr operon transcriptional regulator/uracil phosphoribosyltransferase PyrR [Phragmitibacter flavus]|uniref:Bifunctional pyr operon transcriptional regulator/uracil phosphoribosyltransferase PyrR n=1 Tax=Phragmitibacter flavus TaxID=2576071 RepID=A0A5R8KC32_9BACT|nr:bifunctional pyr operon transcriptional regulator/uracil phosphoribosyltransferase PyrR [Phragmitibacter flavus]TLD69851.1 bifunctional pyr operon transcriptional regulator/uracil phosphoribosyltransferase PyrR [Phragmitibacter flavus]
MPDPAPLFDHQAITQRIERLANLIRENHPDGNLALVGIHSRGVPLAERLYALLKPHFPDLELGRVDISLYRDDLGNLATIPKLIGSDIPFDLDDKNVILCDEVTYTGRTTRAAIEELLDYGRPAKVEIAAFIDRDGREFPIHAAYIGEHLDILPHQRVQVRFTEVDGEDAVYIQDHDIRRPS